MENKSIIHHSLPTLTRKDLSCVSRQMESLSISTGEVALEFENRVAKTHGYSQAFSSASGSMALVDLLNVMNIGSGDEVLVSRYTCQSVEHAIRSTGAIPIFYEVNELWQAHASSVLSLIGNRTRALILVHIYGIDSSFEELDQVRIPVIDDLCQAFGLRPKHGRREAAFFSFNATKCLTMGEGGAFCVASHLADGKIVKNTPSFRLSDYQACLGLSQLDQYSDFLLRRREIATFYLKNLNSSTIKNSVLLNGSSIWFRFPITIDLDFDQFRKLMFSEGIHVRRGVDELLGVNDNNSFQLLPTWNVFQSTASIPIYPSLLDDDMHRVATSINKIMND